MAEESESFYYGEIEGNWEVSLSPGSAKVQMPVLCVGGNVSTIVSSWYNDKDDICEVGEDMGELTSYTPLLSTLSLGEQ